MGKYCISKSITYDFRASEKSLAAARMFGVVKDDLISRVSRHNCEVEISAGDIVYITGPSGAGKSILLRELEGTIPEEDRVNVEEIELPADRAVIDCVEGDLIGSLKVLSAAGLSDVFCVLNSPMNLSDGEKWRFRLAAALGGGRSFIFADEFCSNLDRVTAAVISHNVRKFADRSGRTFILAGCGDDLLIDLEPDVLIVKELGGETEVVYKNLS